MGQCGMCRYENCSWPMHCDCECHDDERRANASADADRVAVLRAEGAADERAKIVADLRREADALDAAYDELRISRAPGSAMQSVFDKAEMCRSLASRIERNEHRKGGG